MGVFAVIGGATPADIGAGIAMRPTGGGAAEHPERVVGAVLAREDVEIQLRLALLQRGKRQKRRNRQKKGAG